MYNNFLNVLTPKISLIHKKQHICNIHTLGDTWEKFCFTLPHFPLYIYIYIYENLDLNKDRYSYYYYKYAFQCTITRNRYNDFYYCKLQD